jgi:alkylhydroperoxidase/carboxymuconolactone decarboxylase family protein YurZ
MQKITINVPQAVNDAVSRAHGIVPHARGKLASIAPRLPDMMPDPKNAQHRAALRNLVNNYDDLLRIGAAAKTRTSDRVSRKTGDVIPCLLSEEDKQANLMLAQQMDRNQALQVKSIERLLEKFPVYHYFLRHVYGIGPVTAARLLSEIDPGKGQFAASLRRFCGVACMDDGQGNVIAQRKRKGVKMDYNQSLKTALWTVFCDIYPKQSLGRRVVAKEIVEAGKKRKVYATDENGEVLRKGGEELRASPYWVRMMEYRHRMLQHDPIFAKLRGQIIDEDDEASETVQTADDVTREEAVAKAEEEARVEAAGGAAHGVTGPDVKAERVRTQGTAKHLRMRVWRVGAQLFLEHLYIVWRTLEGLEVWPGYHEATRGYLHMTHEPVENKPEHLTLEEALRRVGVLDKVQAASPLPLVTEADVRHVAIDATLVTRKGATQEEVYAKDLLLVQKKLESSKDKVAEKQARGRKRASSLAAEEVPAGVTPSTPAEGDAAPAKRKPCRPRKVVSPEASA